MQRLNPDQAASASPRSPSEGTVYGLDNVPLDLPIAGVGSRVLAGFLDYLVVGVLVTGWVLASVVVAGVMAAVVGKAALILIAVVLLGVFAIEYGYFAGFEILTGGRTLGKMALGLQAVTCHGGQPSSGVLLMRNLTRSIDLLVGVPMMALDSTARRLGDRLAGTVVVYLEDPEPETTLHRIPHGWGGSEVALLEAFLRREPEMDRHRARRVASQLLKAIRRDDPEILEGFSDADDPVQTLRQAMARERP